MLYSCTHTATVGVKGLIYVEIEYFALQADCFHLHFLLLQCQQGMIIAIDLNRSWQSHSSVILLTQFVCFLILLYKKNIC